MNTQSKTPTLLHIDASPRGARSRSRQLGRRFLDAWRSAHPDANVIVRDVGNEPPPFVSEAWVEGAFTPADQHSPAAQHAIAISNQYVDELLAANEVVITTPIYNLSVPAVLKAWIDQIVRFGRTFNKAPGGFEGLAKGKRVIVIVTSGSDFRLSSPGGAFNHLEPYLRAVFGFIGITQVEFVYAHSTSSADVGERAFAEAETNLQQLAVAAA